MLQTNLFQVLFGHHCTIATTAVDFKNMVEFWNVPEPEQTLVQKNQANIHHFLIEGDHAMGRSKQNRL